jgi:peptidyl-prolyl cis-trans isomerase D
MLDALRRGAQSWLAKILFAVLIVSFGVFWNVSDVYRGYGRGSIARVGDTDITVNEFQREFQNQIRMIPTEGGGKLTTEQALAYRLDRRALDRLIAQAAVKDHAQALKLALSDSELVEGMRRDPDFAGPDGKFSRSGFEGLLGQMGLSEQGFLAVRREDELRRQLTEALRGAIVAPKPMVDGLNAWRNETRTIEHVKLEPSKVVKVATPDDAKLKEVYEANKGKFMTPEYRKLALLLLTVDDLKKDVTLTDDEIKASYQDTKETYDRPERRRLQQIAFKDKAAAEAARKELVEGKKNFLDVAKDAGAKESDVNLGMLTKKQLIDPKIADAAFSLPRDQISEVIEGRFAPVIVRAIEIEPGKESTLDEVKDQVPDKLAKQRELGHMQEKFDLVEEGRNAGKTLKEIGDEHKLRFIDIEATDKTNKAPDGKTAVDYPDATLILKEAFSASPGLANDAIELPGDSFAWYDVISATEPKQKPFDDVKGEVKDFYTDSETQRQLEEAAQKFVDRLKAGEEFAKVAADAGGTPEVTDPPVKREMSPPGLTVPAVKQAFALPKGGAGHAETSDGKSRIVFQVKEIKPAEPLSKEQSDVLAKELRGDLENDFLIAYIDALKNNLGVVVHEEELKRVTGADAAQQ